MSKLLEMDGGDCALILREDGAVDLIVPVLSDAASHHEYYMGEAALTAAGVMFALENNDWRDALVKKARVKIMKGLRNDRDID
tara:strand:+ start:456 stop:704 length:249 start_codon:yes stop_codon:yes gene_type:complete